MQMTGMSLKTYHLHMVIHLPHVDGVGVTFNDITKDAAFYTTMTTSRFLAWLGAFSQERQGLWLSKDDLKDSSSWSSPPLVLCDMITDIHNGLLANYDCKDSAPPPGQPGVRARPGRNSEDGLSQKEEAVPLLIPQLNRLHEGRGLFQCWSCHHPDSLNRLTQ